MTPIDAMARLSQLLQAADRPDLAERVAAAYSRAVRPATVVCVVGQFKEGKSSLVNGLLGVDVCPVDDDLATSAITVVRYGDTLGAVVRHRVDGATADVPVEVEALPDWVSEQGNPGNAKQVERVDIVVPSSLLADGLILVDTPGMGGLGAGHAAATLGFLRFADALVLVSDATSELTAPELEFLDEALEWCPTAMLVQTKTDMAPAWQRIVELNRGHLAARDLDLSIVTVSSALRAAAFERKNRALNDRSGFPLLIEELTARVAAPGKARALARAATESRSALTMVQAALQQQRDLLADPSTLDAVVSTLEDARARLDHLRGPGSRWSTVMNDRVTDVSSKVTHEFRQASRALLRRYELELEELATGEQWDDMVRSLQSDVAAMVADAFGAVEQARTDIRAELADVLQADLDLGIDEMQRRGIDTTAMWTGGALGQGQRRQVVAASMAGLRGAQSGIVMLGTVGRFLPAAAAGLLAMNPVIIAAGAVFGGLQMLDLRKRRVQERRQAARMQLRQFVDDVLAEVGNELAIAMRELQRELRDEVSARLNELVATCTATIQQAQADAKRTADDAGARGAVLDQQLASLAAIDAVLVEVAA